MTLTVEDGTGVTGADSYVALTAYQIYGGKRGWTFADSDSGQEIVLRRAFDALERNNKFKGTALMDTHAFPLKDADEVPAGIMTAQMEMANLIQGGLDPFETITTSVTSSRKKVGPIETETESEQLYDPRLRALEGLLAPFLSITGINWLVKS